MKIAVVGGGQLAQMMGEAGQNLNVKIVSSGQADSCAFSSCEPFTKDIEKENYLKEFLDGIDVFTFESEHEGLDVAKKVSDFGIPVYPSAEFVQIAGDRFLEKSHLTSLGIPVAPFELIDANLTETHLRDYIDRTLNENVFSENGIVIKTRHGGYDGKGQWVLTKTKDNDLDEIASQVFKVLVNPGCIVEGLVDFSIECSIIASRSTSGEFKTWPLTHNIHEDSILRFSYAPITQLENIYELENQAIKIAGTLCEQSGYVGTIGVECFVTQDGLVVNEIAPRVHNSGHWTIEGATTSQFENHIRAICSLPLGDTTSQGFSCMVNLVGIDVDKNAINEIENAHLHWYGKEVRPNRKVGHVTIVSESEEKLREQKEKVLKIVFG